ncbi:hypothetical protein BCIN_09g06310 [Botrytis cinerea B05.10]|uniref:Uncharacterized protein n=1 Tax=Botryotinia fuckeliana (strain B05.10) TaxID=332648 RepID=A0A384JTI2_BOTFB|nr:hypothetical protein BCIN_09g06310 [Botrytis cinerea B05.10]ATZ53863.1 hypothetical protein BCIN_09g06310 [Botrytis cinerea B05.10]
MLESKPGMMLFFPPILQSIKHHFLATSNDEASFSSKRCPLSKPSMRIDNAVLLYLFQPMASFIFSTSFIRYRHCAQFPSLANILAASSTKFSNSERGLDSNLL